MAGISGPCPLCGTHLTAPASRGPTRKTGRQTGRTGKRRGRIPADSFIDQSHLANRESMKSIKAIAWFILTICACIAASWFLGWRLAL